MIRKRVGWLSALFLGEMLTACAMGFFEKQIARAVVLALFIPCLSGCLTRLRWKLNLSWPAWTAHPDL
jgi:Mg/Co/Ni transporter MgtE